jgi:REP element-mobilizing transposase RayT
MSKSLVGQWYFIDHPRYMGYITIQMRARQLKLFPTPDLQHGGQTRIGRRKIARPIDPKRPLHLVLRSSKARGAWSMLHPRHARRVDALVRETARKYAVRIERYANVGNHLHVLLLPGSRRTFRAFIRELTGRVAALVTGARKLQPLERKFWDFLPYTRIVSWGRDRENLSKYFIKNLFEAAGLLTKKAKEAGLQVIPWTEWAAPPG